MTYTKNDIFAQLDEMGARRDGIVMVHTSLRSVGQIEGDYKLANLVAAPEQFQISGPESDVNAVAAAVATLLTAWLTLA